MEHFFSVDVSDGQVAAQHPRAIELVETWNGADFGFLCKEAVETFQSRFDFDGSYSLAFNSLGLVSAVAPNGAWIERLF